MFGSILKILSHHLADGVNFHSEFALIANNFFLLKSLSINSIGFSVIGKRSSLSRHLCVEK